MRGLASALFGAAMVSLFWGAGEVAAERVWTDHIPTGRSYVKPPPPQRRMSPEEFAAIQLAEPLPPLPPLAIDPLRQAILEFVTGQKAEAKSPGLHDLLDQLGGLYAAERTGPFWIKDQAFNAAARAASAEMARADRYALDPAAFTSPALLATDTASIAEAEVRMSLAVMTFAQEAFGARFAPNDISLWLDHAPEVPQAGDLLPRVAAAGDAAAELRKMHPSHPDFEVLRQAYLIASGKQAPNPVALPERVPEGPLIKVGEVHTDVAVVRRRLNVPSDRVAPTFLDRELADEIRNYLRRNGKRARREINDDLRALLNAPPPPPKMAPVRTIEANMMRWRWLPRNLGSVHIWNNIPEFETRLVKDGGIIHRERIIVGQTEQQTPVFSDKMEHIVFKPQWGVPNSIKITDLLPKLRGGDLDVLERRGMKILKDGREIEPDKIKWDKVDISYVTIVQGPSNWNPLGQMKFMFPNRHSVYMHDTTTKDLFSSTVRTYSHGCIRVRNPRKLAEAIFTEVQGWDANRITDLLQNRAPENNQVDLERPINVHNVYFTLVRDGDGELKQLADVYGHDRRMSEALAGKSLSAIANNDPARIHKRRVEEIEKSTRLDGASSTLTAALAAKRRASETASVEEDYRFATQRSALGASSDRGYRGGRSRSNVHKPLWSPVISFWGD